MFGERLRMWRRARGLSRRALAERVGVSVRAIERYERGQDYPDGQTTHALADALDVPIHALFMPRLIDRITLTHCCQLDF